MTSNLSNRLKDHNSGAGGTYTKENRPYKLIYYEAYLNKKDASKAESFYKTGYGREILREKLENYFKKSKKNQVSYCQVV
mgnify:CR=1 FL=1